MGNKHGNKVFIAPLEDPGDNNGAPSKPTENGLKPKHAGIFVGCQVLCRDEFKSKYTGDLKYKWRPAEIVEVDGLKVLIHFCGWSEKHDKWIDLESDTSKLAPLRLLPAEQRDLGSALTEDQLNASYEYMITGNLPAGYLLPPGDDEPAAPFVNSARQPSTRLSISSARSVRKLSFSNDFIVGQKVEVQDIYKTKTKDIISKWRESEVVEVSGPLVKIHFVGWEDKWDLTIDVSKQRERIRMPSGVLIAASDEPGHLERLSSSRRRSMQMKQQQSMRNFEGDNPQFTHNLNSEESDDSSNYSTLLNSPDHSTPGSSRNQGGQLSARGKLVKGGSGGSLVSSARMRPSFIEIQRQLSVVDEEDDTKTKEPSNGGGSGTGVQKFIKMPSMDGGSDLARIKEAVAAVKKRMTVEETIKADANASRSGTATPTSSRLRREERRQSSTTWVNEPLDTGRRTELAEEAFFERMEKAGLHIVEVQYDGNCLFRAVSFLLYDTEDEHEQLRNKCVEHMEKYRARFELFCTGDMEEHLKKMKRVSTYAEELEIKALEEVLDRVFYVYSVESAATAGQALVPISVNIDECNLLGGVAPVKLSFHGKNRYNAVMDEKQNYPLEERESTMLMYERVKTFEAMFPDDSWDDEGGNTLKSN